MTCLSYLKKMAPNRIALRRGWKKSVKISIFPYSTVCVAIVETGSSAGSSSAMRRNVNSWRSNHGSNPMSQVLKMVLIWHLFSDQICNGVEYTSVISVSQSPQSSVVTWSQFTIFPASFLQVKSMGKQARSKKLWSYELFT